MVQFSFKRFIVPLLAAAAVAAAGLPAGSVPDFSFIQVSDIHAPMAQSKDVIGALANLPAEIEIPGYGVKVPRPSFVIATGDLNEFGGGSGWWDEYMSYWKPVGLPVYNELGNHDNTWHAGIRSLRSLNTGPYYSFDRSGCHFVGLMSATVQDPRPSFGAEQIEWLKKDLAKVSRDTTVFVFFHHPLEGTEFASSYDWQRVLDVLRPYNVALIMTGHYHGVDHKFVQGVDQIIGGSTFGPNAGFMLVSVVGNTLRGAYQKTGQAAPEQKVFEKPLAAASSYPNIRILEPVDSPSSSSRLNFSNKPLAGAKAGTVKIRARVDADGITRATYTIDDSLKGDLALNGKEATGEADTSGLLAGAHYLRVTFYRGEIEYCRSGQFLISGSGPKVAWRRYMGTSSKATPAIADGVVYFAGNDGKLTALKAATGQQVWSKETGAEILGQPLVTDKMVAVANGLGKVMAFKLDGKPLWEFEADDAVYGGPVLAGDKVVAACNKGKLYGLDAASGEQAWEYADATYAAEASPWVYGDKVIFGAWDQYIRCVKASDGTQVWKQIGEGSNIEKAKRYYSPGDAVPVVAEGKAFVADRKYMLTILNADTGERIGAQEGVAGTGVSEDGKFVYLRKTNGDLAKVDSSGNVIWKVAAEMNAIPTAPVEKDGLVFVASGKGKVSAVSAKTGQIVWQYQASPGLFVMSNVASDGKRAYVSSFDGYLTAIEAL